LAGLAVPRKESRMSQSTTVGSLHIERFIQSSFLIKSPDVVLYVDPHRIEGGQKADLILLTHEHFDHLDLASIDALRKEETIIVANAPCARKLADRGRVIALEEGETARRASISRPWRATTSTIRAVSTSASSSR
jgi:L-ascorbate metabolism protein UlaG (beta-lactamase superfamily)